MTLLSEAERFQKTAVLDHALHGFTQNAGHLARTVNTRKIKEDIAQQKGLRLAPLDPICNLTLPLRFGFAPKRIAGHHES